MVSRTKIILGINILFNFSCSVNYVAIDGGNKPFYNSNKFIKNVLKVRKNGDVVTYNHLGKIVYKKQYKSMLKDSIIVKYSNDTILKINGNFYFNEKYYKKFESVPYSLLKYINNIPNFDNAPNGTFDKK